MGGIVAAETAIAVTSEHPIHGSTNPAVDDDSSSPPPRPPTPNSLMFPYIRGVLAFDTPFLGVSPGVVAHGAEGHLATAQTALAQISSLTGLFGGAKAASADARAATAASRKPIAALPAPESKTKDNNSKNAPAAAPADGGWGKWGKIAMVAGAVGAVAAGGAAAYINRDQLSQGWTSLASHMEFVGCLARKEELRRRTAYMVKLNRELGMGFGNLYTRLGKAAGSRTDSVVGTVLGNDRTFCVVPKKDIAGDWRPAVNDKATDETWAHMCEYLHFTGLLGCVGLTCRSHVRAERQSRLREARQGCDGHDFKLVPDGLVREQFGGRSPRVMEGGIVLVERQALLGNSIVYNPDSRHAPCET